MFIQTISTIKSMHNNKYSNNINFFYSPPTHPYIYDNLQNQSQNELNTTSRTTFSSFGNFSQTCSDTKKLSIKRKNQLRPTSKIGISSTAGISMTTVQGKKNDKQMASKPQSKSKQHQARMSETLSYDTIKPTFGFTKYFGLCGMENGTGGSGCRCFQQPCQWSIIWTKSHTQKSIKLYKNLRLQRPQKKTGQQIQKDLPRTYPDCPTYSQNPQYRMMLGNILLTYSIYDRETNYTQGMNMIAAVLLYHIKKQQETFWSFVDLMDEQQLRMIYLPGFEYLKKHTKNIINFIQNKIQDLFTLMQELEIQAEVFLYGWLLSLMSNCVPLEYMHLVVEKFRVEGWHFIYKLVITYLLFLKNALLMSTDCSQFYSQISNTNSKDLGLHWHQILQNCHKVEI